MKTIAHILNDHSASFEYSFKEEFINIIARKCEGYDGKPKDKLKSFFNDLQHGGCISGMIGEFIYNSDNKEFYINHLDDLEDYKTELEDSLGEPIKDRNSLPHYTFVVWLCFEEFCYTLYSDIFEQ